MRHVGVWGLRNCEASALRRVDAAPVEECAACPLRYSGLCGALGPEDLAMLRGLAETVTLAHRQPVFAQGGAAHMLYMVREGCVRVQRDLSDGRRQVVGFALPGNVVGLAQDDIHLFGADSVGPSVLHAFDARAFRRLAMATPALLGGLRQQAAHELNLAQEHMVLLGRRRAEERVAAFLLDWRVRREALFGHSPTIELPMNRQDIADYLGLTIETVSRTFARMMRDGVLIDAPSAVRVRDEARLAALVPS